MIDLSVIIPTFNARSRAQATVETLQSRLAATRLRWEIVLVDDGSRVEERPDAATVPGGVRVLQIDRNRGKGHAVRSGLAVATGRARIFTDVDLPYGTDSILECFEKLDRGDADFVYDDKIILEVKAQQGVVNNHLKQTINYLAASKIKLGLIINFGEDSLKFKRVIL